MMNISIGRVVICLIAGACILAAIVTLVPPPLQLLAVLIALPVESLLLAIAGSDAPLLRRQRTTAV